MLYVHEKWCHGEFVRRPEKVLVHKKTAYQEIAIVRYAPPFGRTLYIDGWLQSDELRRKDYHVAMLSAIPETFNALSVLILGGGPGNAASVLLTRWPEATVLDIDIDREAGDLFSAYLSDWAPQGLHRYTKMYKDARTIFSKLGKSSFDVILFDIDVSTSPAEQGGFDKMLSEVSSRLNPGGWFVGLAGDRFLDPGGEGVAPYVRLNEQYQLHLPGGTYVDYKDMGWRFYAASHPAVASST